MELQEQLKQLEGKTLLTIDVSNLEEVVKIVTSEGVFMSVAVDDAKLITVDRFTG